VGVIGLAAAIGILGSIGTACGSRTSMLDSDAYDSSRDGVVGVAGSAAGSGAGTAGKGSNGMGLLGRAGSGSTPPGGGPPRDVDSTLALTPCQQYCPGYGTQCNKRLEGQDCLSTCQGELNGYGTSCQTLGISALRCLTPFFSANGGDCDAAVNRALGPCGMIVAAFDNCKKGFDGSTTPTKPPREALANCGRMGGGDTTSCTEVFSCSYGDYISYCSLATGSMFLDCGCVGPSGRMATGLLPPAGDVCLDAALLCQ
jgi:hypothetical protein